MKKVLISTVIVFLFLIGGTIGSYYYLFNNPHLMIELQMAGKDFENPESDAARDLAKGSVYCYRLNGFGPYLPGIESDLERDVCKNATEINIYGTSDSVRSLSHAKAISRARDYAYKYNKHIAGYGGAEFNK